MANIILVIGESGSGKSSSTRNLDPAETFLVNFADKELPFKGAAKKYQPVTKDNPQGNTLRLKIPGTREAVQSNQSVLLRTFEYVDQKRPEIKTVVMDDAQYFMAFEFMSRAKDKGYEKFTELANNLFQMVRHAKSLRDDLTVVFLWHEQEVQKGMDTFYKAKTIGKLFDEKVTLEGLFTVVLRAVCDPEEREEDEGYCFLTKDLNSTTKTPLGMFEESHIPNDLKFVLAKVHAYYNED